jgi:hypothetical protein
MSWMLAVQVILQMVYDNQTTGVLPYEGSKTSYSLSHAAASSRKNTSSHAIDPTVVN